MNEYKWQVETFTPGVDAPEDVTDWLNTLEQEYEVDRVVSVPWGDLVVVLARVHQRWDTETEQAFMRTIEATAAGPGWTTGG